MIRKEGAALTGARLLRRPRNLAAFVFFYVFLVLFRICLVSMIRINAATVMNFAFHCHAMELLYQVRALLNFRSAR